MCPCSSHTTVLPCVNFIILTVFGVSSESVWNEFCYIAKLRKLVDYLEFLYWTNFSSEEMSYNIYVNRLWKSWQISYDNNNQSIDWIITYKTANSVIFNCFLYLLISLSLILWDFILSYRFKMCAALQGEVLSHSIQILDYTLQMHNAQ